MLSRFHIPITAQPGTKEHRVIAAPHTVVFDPEESLGISAPIVYGRLTLSAKSCESRGAAPQDSSARCR